MDSEAAQLQLEVLMSSIRTGELSVRAPTSNGASGDDDISENLSSPRGRLLARFASIAASTASRDHDAAFGEDVPLAERHAMQVGNAVTSMLNKCRRYGACLACTLNPCICSQMPPLALSHLPDAVPKVVVSPKAGSERSVFARVELGVPWPVP